MEAQELRINNYLKYNDFLIIVEAISIDYVYGRAINSELGKPSMYKIKINDVTHIQLTDEFFAKNEFILRESLDDNCKVVKSAVYKTGDEFLFIPIDGEYYLAVFDEYDFGYIPGCRPIKFLHELQNIYFDLKGEKLKIVELCI